MDLLSQLSALVAELCTCEQASDDVLRAAQQFREDCKAQDVPDEAKPAMRRELVRAAAQLAALDAKLGAGLMTGAAPEAGVEESVSRHVTAACLVLLAGLQLCQQFDLQGALQGSVGLLLGCGTHLLEAYASGRVRSAADGVSSAGEQGAAAVGTPWPLAEQCVEAQAKCMAGLLGMDAVGLAADTDPSAFARWLVALCGAVHAVHKAQLERGKPPPAGVLYSLVFTLHIMTCVDAPWVRQHNQAVAQQPSLPQLVVDLLEPAVRAAGVALALPEEQRPVHYTWQLTDMLLSVLTWPEVAPPIRALIGSRGGESRASTSGGHDSGGITPAAHRLLTRLVNLLDAALSGLAKGEGRCRTAMASCAIECSQVAGSVCSAVLTYARTATSVGSQHWVELQRLKAPLLKAVRLMPRVMELAHDAATVDALAVSGATDAQQHRRGLGPPNEAALKRAVLAGTMYDCWATIVLLLDEAACLSTAAQQRWFLCTQTPPPVPALADAAACCAVSTPALRLLHCIREATDAVQLRDVQAMLPPHLVDAPADLAAAIMGLSSGAAELLCNSTQALTAAAAQAQADAVAAALHVAYALHSAVCRCLQWMVQHDQSMLESLVSLTSVTKACAALQALQCHAPLTPELKEQSDRQITGAAAASWHAILAVAAGSGAELAAKPGFPEALAWTFCLGCNQDLNGLMTSQPVLGLMDDIFTHWSRGDNSYSRVAQSVVEAVQGRARLVVGLVRNGLLWRLAEACPRGGSLALDALLTMARGGERILRVARTPPEQQTEAWRQRLSQAAAALKRAVLQQRAQRTHALRRRLEEPAEQLAGLYEEWCERPGLVAFDRQLLAEAAAIRSCAYLRCANLAFEGGPFGRPGCGAQRCGKCRAVYYCGTACSHADWRAGHRQVCAELAAMRQQQRAQQQPQQQG